MSTVASLGGAWDTFRDAIFTGAKPSLAQLVEMRRSFYAGARVTFGILLSGLSPGNPDVITEQDLNHIDRLNAELEGYLETIGTPREKLLACGAPDYDLAPEAPPNPAEKPVRKVVLIPADETQASLLLAFAAVGVAHVNELQMRALGRTDKADIMCRAHQLAETYMLAAFAKGLYSWEVWNAFNHTCRKLTAEAFPHLHHQFGGNPGPGKPSGE